MALTTTELSQIKNWLGYSNLTASARPFFDVAQVFEVVVQDNLDAYGESYLRQTILPNLTQLEADLFASRGRYKAAKVDEVVLNPKEFDQLIGQREWWINRLSETLRVPRVMAATGIGARMDLY